TSGAATDGVGTTDVAGGFATGYDTGWREGAVKVIVWFGDAVSHTTTVDQAEANAALTGENVVVAAINTAGAGSGIDGAGQATAIVAATGGTLTNNVSGANSEATKNAILAAISDATSSFDLSLFTTGDTSGLDIDFTCTDPEGCTGVGGGESRTFDMVITGMSPGVYDFETRVTGISSAVELDTITVTGDGPVPVPAPGPLSLMGLGLLGLAYLRRRRIL
ncbi:MAG TPA: PEP-CTERM sorting domain-containing protein, partial [Thioalkalivibrio sp.]|nr:PEP-CTERM sorting domain-containing protein [Thioalkalivibrio sp.]